MPQSTTTSSSQPEDAVHLAVVQKDGWKIRDVPNPTQDVILAAVQQNGWALQSVRSADRSLDVCLAALAKSSIGVLRYWPVAMLTAPHHQIFPFLQNHHPDFLFDDDDIQILPPSLAWMMANWPEPVFRAALAMMPPEVQRETESLRGFFQIPLTTVSEQDALTAVALRGNTIEFIQNPSLAIQLVAVRQNSWAIEHIKNPCEAVQLAAIQGGDASAVVITVQRGGAPQARSSSTSANQPALISEAVQIAAVTADPLTIGQIHHPTPAAQLKAVQRYGEVLFGIDRPTAEACHAALASAGLIVLTHWTPAAKQVDHAVLFDALTRMPDNDNDEFHESSRSGCEDVLVDLLSRWSADQLIKLATVRPGLFEPVTLIPLLRNALVSKASPAPNGQQRASRL